MDTVSLIQIGDCHLGNNEHFKLKGINTFSMFNNVLSNLSNVNNDIIAETGDISEDGSRSSYHLFSSLFRHHSCNANLCIPGNHDNSEFMASELDSLLDKKIVRLKNWLFIGLNSQVQQQDYGELPYSELNFLEGCLSDNTHLNIAIFLHHHVLPVGSEWADKYGLRNDNAFLKLILKHKNIKAVISGHVHQAFNQRKEHIEFYCGPSSCLQFLPNAKTCIIEKAVAGFQQFFFRSTGKVSNSITYVHEDSVSAV